MKFYGASYLNKPEDLSVKLSFSMISPSELIVRPTPSVTELAEKKSNEDIVLTPPPTGSELPVLTTSVGFAPVLEAAHKPWLLVVETPPEPVARVAEKMMPPFAGNANWLKDANLAPTTPGALSSLRNIFVKVPFELIVQTPLALDEVTFPPVARAPVKAISLALFRSGAESDWNVWFPVATPVRTMSAPVPFEE